MTAEIDSERGPEVDSSAELAVDGPKSDEPSKRDSDEKPSRRGSPESFVPDRDAISKTRGLVVRANSSPALGERGGRYEGCTSLSDVAQVLFSTNENPPSDKQRGTSEAQNFKRKDSRIDERDAESRNAKLDRKRVKSESRGDEDASTERDGGRAESQNGKKSGKIDGKRKENATESRKHGAGDRVAAQNEETGGGSTTPACEEKNAVDQTRSIHRTPNVRRQQTKYSSAHNLGASKARHDARLSQRNTFSGYTARSRRAPTRGTPRATETKDLLSSFVTYKDQLPPASDNTRTPNKQCVQLPQYSPKRLSVTKTRHKEKPQSSLKKNRPDEDELQIYNRPDEDGMQICSIESNQASHLRHTPESQRQAGPPKIPKRNRGGPASPPVTVNQNRPRSKLQLVFDFLRILVIMFSIASLIAKGLMAFGGKRSILHYASNSPMLWTVRGYIAVLCAALIIVELDVGIPLLVPLKTLDNFLQKGYVTSFVGLLDLCMNTNKSLTEFVDEMQGEGVLSERVVRIRCAYVTLGISGRGMIACGFIYMFLGLFGHSGETKRNLVNRAS